MIVTEYRELIQRCQEENHPKFKLKLNFHSPSRIHSSSESERLVSVDSLRMSCS